MSTGLPAQSGTDQKELDQILRKELGITDNKTKLESTTDEEKKNSDKRREPDSGTLCGNGRLTFGNMDIVKNTLRVIYISCSWLFFGPKDANFESISLPCKRIHEGVIYAFLIPQSIFTNR
jgi:hypothetical protein